MAAYPPIAQTVRDQQQALANEVAATRARAEALEANHQAAVRQLEQQSAALEQLQRSVSQPQVSGTVPYFFGVPPHQQPFVVGPGFAPIPYKIVSAIVGGGGFYRIRTSCAEALGYT